MDNSEFNISILSFAQAYNNSKRCFVNYCSKYNLSLGDIEWMIKMAHKKGYITRKYYRL